MYIAKQGTLKIDDKIVIIVGSVLTVLITMVILVLQGKYGVLPSNTGQQVERAYSCCEE